MKRQQSLEHRLQTLHALHDAVGAMRSLAAHHFRRSRDALSAARGYRDEMNTLIAEIGLRQRLTINNAPGLLVLASDLGLCGDYNRRLADETLAQAASLKQPRVYSVGRRVRGALAHHGLIPHRSYSAPASLDGLPALVLGLAEDLLQDNAEGRLTSLQVISATFNGVGHFTPACLRVLPIEPVSATQPLERSPYLDPDQLTQVAVREFLYITLYELLLDAMAAEHGMRLMAAEAALDWLDTTAADTSRRLSSARSEASTQELLDIVSGSRQRLRADRA